MKYTNEEFKRRDEEEDRDEDAEDDKLEKSRERNRAHARQTRLRKKNHLDALKSRLLALQEEAIRLQQLVDESSTANILLCLSSTRSDDSSEESSSPSFSSPEMGTNYEGDIVDQLKHTVRAESASGKRKSGICDLDMNSGEDQFPTKARRDSDVSETMSEVDEYDKIRKERNRMHAKLTRDRKKLFTAKVCEMIELLERNNRIMLQKLCASSAESPIDIRTKEEKEKMHSYWAPGSLNYLEGKTASAMSELTSI